MDSKSSLFYNMYLYKTACLKKCIYWKQLLEQDINIINSHSELIILSELSLSIPLMEEWINFAKSTMIISFWAFSHVPLICVFVFIPVPYCFDDNSFVI